jgi:hypothetical protein
MHSTTTLIDPGGRATGETLYLALFRVAAIADLKGPAKAIEWAQSVLDDDRLRGAFVAGVAAREARGSVFQGERPAGAVPRERRHSGSPLQSSHAGHPGQAGAPRARR